MKDGDIHIGQKIDTQQYRPGIFQHAILGIYNKGDNRNQNHKQMPEIIFSESHRTGTHQHENQIDNVMIYGTLLGTCF